MEDADSIMAVANFLFIVCSFGICNFIDIYFNNYIINLLARSSYEGPLLLELNCYDPEPEVFLQKAYKAGCYLDTFYQKEKTKLADK